MNRKRNFEFLEHTADVYIAAYGKNLAEVFENAATAMFEVMTEINQIEAEVEDYIEVNAEDEYALLYSWLEELLVKYDVDNMLYCKFTISELEKIKEGFRLKAKIWGEEFNPKKHPQKVGVKAITYHRMEIIEKPEKAMAKFILDI